MIEPRISIIVPTLNEERQIGTQLGTLKRLSGLHDVVVADGGSRDRTRDLVLAEPWCRLVASPPGRAVQMNAGARASSGDVLLFLHADVRLPPDAAMLITAALRDSRVVAGAFRTRTVSDGRPPWSAVWLRIADLRSRYTRLPYGDQALFVRRSAFERVGGFPSQPLFEDFEISRRLRKLGRIRTVDASVQVSGRRFLARPVYYAFIMNVLPLLYRAGVPPSALARAYPHVR